MFLNKGLFVIGVGSTVEVDGDTLLVTAIEPPHKDNASGYITTSQGRFYAHCYECKWHDDESVETYTKMLVAHFIHPVIEKDPDIGLAMTMLMEVSDIMPNEIGLPLLGVLFGKKVLKEAAKVLGEVADHRADHYKHCRSAYPNAKAESTAAEEIAKIQKL